MDLWALCFDAIVYLSAPLVYRKVEEHWCSSRQKFCKDHMLSDACTHYPQFWCKYFYSTPV